MDAIPATYVVIEYGRWSVLPEHDRWLVSDQVVIGRLKTYASKRSAVRRAKLLASDDALLDQATR